jgi:hypothetical protein
MGLLLFLGPDAFLGFFDYFAGVGREVAAQHPVDETFVVIDKIS